MFGFLRRTALPAKTPTWQAAPLFAALSSAELATLAEHAKPQQISRGTQLLVEGTSPEVIYLIHAGQLEVTKREAHTDRSHRIKILGPGEMAGEVEFLDHQASAATVIALTDCEVTALDLLPLREARPDSELEQGIYFKLVASLATTIAVKLRQGSEDAVKSAHRRTAMGELIVNLLILLCTYVIFVAALSSHGLKPHNTMFLSLPLLLIFGVASWRFMRTSGYPLRDFGLTSARLLPSLFESGVVTLALLFFATGIKWLLLRTDADYDNAALIEFPNVALRLAEPKVQLLVVVYAVSCAVQEMIVRGALQSMLERFLTGRHHQLKAVIVCALLFSVSHLHTGVLFPFLVFFPGLVWGWLFTRHRNLLGVTLAHIVLGCYVFFVLGIRLGT